MYARPTLILSVAFLCASFKGVAQCDSFKADFSTVDAASRVEVCKPANFSMVDRTLLNKGDSLIVRCFFYNGSDEPSWKLKPGKIDVQYKVKTKYGCEDSIEKKGYLELLASTVKLSTDDSIYCTGQKIWLRDSSTWVGRNPRIHYEYFGGRYNKIAEANGADAHEIVNRGVGKYSHLFLVTEEIRHPVTGVYEECRNLYPYPFDSGPGYLTYEVRESPEIYVTQTHKGIALDSAHLYSNHYWKLIHGKEDTVVIHDSLSMTWQGYAIIELHTFDGVCHNTMEWRYSSIPESASGPAIWYNPVKATIEFENRPHATGNLTVYDLNGKAQYQEQVTRNGDAKLNVSVLPSGFYLASFKTANESVTIRFVK